MGSQYKLYQFYSSANTNIWRGLKYAFNQTYVVSETNGKLCCLCFAKLSESAMPFSDFQCSYFHLKGIFFKIHKTCQQNAIGKLSEYFHFFRKQSDFFRFHPSSFKITYVRGEVRAWIFYLKNLMNKLLPFFRPKITETKKNSTLSFSSTNGNLVGLRLSMFNNKLWILVKIHNLLNIVQKDILWKPMID